MAAMARLARAMPAAVDYSGSVLYGGQHAVLEIEEIGARVNPLLMSSSDGMRSIHRLRSAPSTLQYFLCSHSYADTLLFALRAFLRRRNRCNLGAGNVGLSIQFRVIGPGIVVPDIDY
jgi:hypothetical protein